MVVRDLKAREAVLAEGRVKRVGTVSVERVYERPCLTWSVIDLVAHAANPVGQLSVVQSPRQVRLRHHKSTGCT